MPAGDQYERLVSQVKLLMKAEQRLVRTQRTVESQNRRFRALSGFALVAPKSHTVQAILDHVLELLWPTFSVQAALAVLHRPEGDGPPLVLLRRGDALCELGPGQADAATAALVWLDKAQVLAHGAPDLRVGPLPTLLDELAPTEPWEQRAQRRRSMVMPFGSGPGVGGVGVLLLCRCAGVSYHEETPVQADEAFLELVCGHASSAVEIAALHADLERRVQARTLDLAVANEQLGVNLRTLRDTQARLVETSRLAAVGQLAGVVAHDIANPLAALKANVHWLGRYEPSPGEAEERVEVLADALASVGRITESVWKLRHLEHAPE